MAFATVADVQARLGRTLTNAEQDMADLVLDLVAGLIADALGQDSDWIDNLNPVPPTFRALSIEKVIGVGSNPNLLASHTETLGQHTDAKTFSRDIGLFLTPDEEERIKKAAASARSASIPMESILEKRLVGEWPSWIINLPELVE